MRAFLLPAACLAFTAACDAEPAQEIGPAVLPLSGEMPLGMALPPAETVVLNGRSYEFRFLAGAGSGDVNTLPDGNISVTNGDLVLIGGTDDPMEAVEVYLWTCAGETGPVPAFWADTPLSRVAVSGEWIFDMGVGCAGV